MSDRSSIPFLPAGAEALVRIDEGVLSGTGTTMSVGAGPWLRDPVVGVCRAAMGVVLDDVTGYSVALAAPDDRWPVSLGIRLDFHGDPPTAGAPMAAVGEVVGFDAQGAISRGEVRAQDGSTVGLITQRSHLRTVAAKPNSPDVAVSHPDPDLSIRELLRLVDVSAGVVEMRPGTFAANERGDVHGGVQITGAEFAAMSALGASGEYRTTSVDIVYLRPGDASDTLTFRAEVVHRGRSMAMVRVDMISSDGKPCSRATLVIQKSV